MNDPETYFLLTSQFHDIQALIAEFPQIKTMKGRIIDIGCGPGDMTEVLLSNLTSDAIVDGTDISQSMIQFAANHFKKENRLSFFQLDIQTPELPQHLLEKYDNAVSFYCLHWCSNLQVVFQNIYSLLRPGGKVLTTFFTTHLIFDVYLEQQKNLKFSPYMKDVLNYIPLCHKRDDAEEIIRKMLQEAGFEILHCSNRWRTFHFDNLEIFFNLLVSVNPFIARMPEDIQEEYKKNLHEEIMKRYQLYRKNLDGHENAVTQDWAMIRALFQKPTQVHR